MLTAVLERQKRWRQTSMAVQVFAVGRDELPPFAMPDRFRHDIAYFMTVAGREGVPTLAENEYWVRLSDARQWLDDGVFRILSPLDSQNCTEIELTEEQEDWLRWMTTQGVEHVRLV